MQIKRTLENYYSKHGEINSIRILDACLVTGGFGYALIQYNRGKYRIIELLNKYGYIETHSLAPFNADTSQITNDILPIEKISSPNILNALNQDCLKEVFERLPLEMLTEPISGVCEQFKEIIKTVASARLTTSETLIYDFKSNTDNWSQCLLRFESFLRQFGKQVKSIELYFMDSVLGEFYQKAALTTLLTYCIDSESSLRQLKIHGLNISMKWRELLWPLFARLEILDLKIIDNYKVNYIGLAFSENNYFNNVPRSNLQVLKLNGRWPWTEFLRKLNNFFGRMTNLKQLELEYFKDDDIQLILNGVFNGNAPVERLRIKSHFYNKFNIEKILKLQQIKKLEFVTDKVDHVDLLKLVDNLPNLKELAAHLNRDMSFCVVADFIESAGKKLQLLKLKYSNCIIPQSFNDFIVLMNVLMKFDKNTDIFLNKKNRNLTIESKIFSGFFLLNIINDELILKFEELFKLNLK